MTETRSSKRQLFAFPKLAYSIDEAVAAISIGKTRLYEDIMSGALPSRKHGRRVLILADDLKAYLAALPPNEPI